jgi:hypothetical protein
MKPKTRINIGAANPYVLAELKLGRRINWRHHSNPRKLLSDTLGVPYEEIFDPRSKSPIFAGKEAAPSEAGGRAVRSAPPVNVGSVNWIDPGDFFEEAAEFSDPQQGGVGDCYFIAALASVGWALPFFIAQRTRATGANQQDFVDMIEFYSGGTKKQIEVTEKLPLASPGNMYIYARSTEPGEIWPAVYEKAYAKWRTNDTGDTPDINLIAGGDPAAALAQLTGWTPYYYDCPSLTADAIYQRVRENSLSRKTFNPMVAWTYCTPPAGVNYSSAHIAGCHAYSILGWDYVNGKQYVILRNPWGNYESVTGVIGGNWVAYDGSFWRTIPLATNDGTFALEVPVFKTYYAGFGVVKKP